MPLTQRSRYFNEIFEPSALAIAAAPSKTCLFVHCGTCPECCGFAPRASRASRALRVSGASRALGASRASRASRAYVDSSCYRPTNVPHHGRSIVCPSGALQCRTLKGRRLFRSDSAHHLPSIITSEPRSQGAKHRRNQEISLDQKPGCDKKTD